MPRKLWHRVDVLLPEHSKVLRAAEMLGVNADIVVGKVLRIWLWAHVHALETGDITPWVTVKQAPKLFNIDAKSEKKRQEIAQRWLNTLISCGKKNEAGLLDRDEDERVFIHGWLEYIGDEIARKSSNLNRQRKFRERQKTEPITVTEPLRNGKVTRQSKSSSKSKSNSNKETTKEALRVTPKEQPQPQEQPLPGNDNIKALIEDPVDNADWLSIVLERYRIEDGAEDLPFPKFRNSVENSAPSWERLYANYGRDGLEIGVCVYFSETSKSDFERGKRSIDNCLTDLWGRFGGALARALEHKDAEAKRVEANKPKPPPTSGDPELDEIWKQTINILKTKISDEDVNTWLDSVYILSKKGNVYTLAVPSDYRRWVIKEANPARMQASQRGVSFASCIMASLARLTGIKKHEVGLLFDIRGHQEETT